MKLKLTSLATCYLVPATTVYELTTFLLVDVLRLMILSEVRVFKFHTECAS